VNTISHLHLGLLVILIAFACPLIGSVIPDQVIYAKPTYPELEGEWGEFFQLKNDFLSSVEMAKCTVGNCWLLLGVIYVVTFGYFRLSLTRHRKRST